MVLPIKINFEVFRGVAQFGSASGLGPEGRRFKSCHPDHYPHGWPMSNRRIFPLYYKGSVRYTNEYGPQNMW